MARPSKKFALFLCLIVLHQDFIQARSSYNDQLVLSSSRMYGRFAREVDEDADQFGNTIQEVEARHNITLDVDVGRTLSRGKRFFGLFIFIVSLVVTVVATVVETIYDIEGCCGLGSKYLCGFESTFNNKRDEIKQRSEVVDQELEKVLEKRDNLECFAEVLKTLWGRMNDLVELNGKLLGSIHPEIKNSLLKKEKEVSDNLAKIGKDLDEQQIEVTVKKLSETQLAIKLATSWGTVAVEGIAIVAEKGYKAYKVNKAYKALKATQLEPLLKASPKAKKLIGFTESSAKLFLKNTAITKFASKAKMVLKGMKFFKAAGAVLSVLSIAFDLFNIINTFVQCKKKSDEARKSYAELEKAETQVQETENNVKNFNEVLRTGLEKQLTEEARDEKLLDALVIVKESIEANPAPNNGQPERDWAGRCSEMIPQYVESFKTSNDWADMKDMMLEILDTCMNKQIVAFKCLIARNNMNTKINTGCQKGSGTFEELYTQALELEGAVINKCKLDGEPYTTKEMFLNDLKAKSKVVGLEFYVENCFMNNLFIVKKVCEGEVTDELTEQQKTTVKTDKCTGGSNQPKLDSSDISSICLYKAALFDTSAILSTIQENKPDVTQSDITAAIATCSASAKRNVMKKSHA